MVIIVLCKFVNLCHALDYVILIILYFNVNLFGVIARFHKYAFHELPCLLHPFVLAQLISASEFKILLE